jgi:DNA transformation protein
MARRNKRAVMSYRRMPDRLYDDPVELVVWARAALAAAQQPKARTAKTVKPPISGKSRKR